MAEAKITELTERINSIDIAIKEHRRLITVLEGTKLRTQESIIILKSQKPPKQPKMTEQEKRNYYRENSRKYYETHKETINQRKKELRQLAKQELNADQEPEN